MEKIAKIMSTHLGPEDHGIWTAVLHVDYGGSGQGVGGYALGDGEFGMQFIKRTVNACGVRAWEQIEGRTILVVTDSDNEFGGRVIGIKPLPTEPGEPFMFDDIKHLTET